MHLATFESIPASVKKQLEKCGYEVTDDLLLYREINAEGKGSCRVNACPPRGGGAGHFVGAALHPRPARQPEPDKPGTASGLLDQYAQNRDLFAEYYRRYRELVTVKRQLDALNASESDNSAALRR